MNQKIKDEEQVLGWFLSAKQKKALAPKEYNETFSKISTQALIQDIKSGPLDRRELVKELLEEKITKWRDRDLLKLIKTNSTSKTVRDIALRILTMRLSTNFSEAGLIEIDNKALSPIKITIAKRALKMKREINQIRKKLNLKPIL